ncbi:MAG: guanylate kinase [Verrucomicrobiales bacterium]|jgi:guanylate kinase|nr:guanylate kinase [Verrucomicrobiales bacterium]
MKRQGIVFVISAPSGAGKSTICEGLRHTADFVYSVSCTTRAPRPGEVNGKDYWFISSDEFKRRVADGEFLEWARVHGNCYGTLREKVLEVAMRGTDVLLDIDVEGARQVRERADAAMKKMLVDVFIMPPSVEELERRLRKRGTENETQIKIRLEGAIREMKLWPRYKYVIVSGSMEEDLARFRAIMSAERCRSQRWEETSAG